MTQIAGVFSLEEGKVEFPHFLLEGCGVVNIDHLIEVLYLLLRSELQQMVLICYYCFICMVFLIFSVTLLHYFLLMFEALLVIKWPFLLSVQLCLTGLLMELVIGFF